MSGKISTGGMHHIALRVRDFDRSVSFYTGLLGFSTWMAWGEKPHRAALLDTGRADFVELWENPNPAAAKDEGALAHFCFRTDDCKKGLEAARAAGWPVTIEPGEATYTSVDGPMRLRYAFFTGPDGESIELLEVTPLAK